MELGMILLAAIGVLVLWWWFMFSSADTESSELLKKVVEPQVVLSEADLKKKTKAQLLEMGKEIGVELDGKLTKAKIIAELVK